MTCGVTWRYGTDLFMRLMTTPARLWATTAQCVFETGWALPAKSERVVDRFTPCQWLAGIFASLTTRDHWVNSASVCAR